MNEEIIILGTKQFFQVIPRLNDKDQEIMLVAADSIEKVLSEYPNNRIIKATLPPDEYEINRIL